MANEPQPHTSFSRWRRWGIRVDFVARTVLVLAVVVMVNHLGARWFHRLYLTTQMRQSLSPLTVGLLHSLTNHVKVTLLYDKEDPLFTTVSALLNDYHNINPRLRVAAVDYLWDAGEAENIKAEYKSQLTSLTNKNLIIFDCGGRVKIVNGNTLAEYVLEQVPNETEREFRRKPTAFLGEKLFTSALLSVTSPKPLNVCYLTGHGEHPLEGGDETGYLTFTSVLRQNYTQVQPLTLTGTNAVPMDCNLLVIAGPTAPLAESELERIDDYLHQGGRLLVLLNYISLKRATGLEKILAGWGVDVGRGTLSDGKNSFRGSDIVVMDFGPRPHPIVNPLTGSALHLILPRAVGRLDVGHPPADAPRVEEIAFTSPAATADSGDARGPGRFSLAVAVEQGRVPGVITDRGSTRLVVVGDSIFLGNHQIESAGNRDFLGCAINWLLERTQFMQGLGPRPITEFRLTMTKSQLRTLQWILLAGMPGAVLLLGGLVWLRRRT
jgi:hypothetical protein